MTTLTQNLPVDQLSAQAREVRFGRTLATAIAGFFYLAGWLLGHAWTGLVFCALSIRLGFREGAGRVPVTDGASQPPGPGRPSKL